MSNRLGNSRGLSYLGTSAFNPPNVFVEDRIPTTHDRAFSVGDIWVYQDHATVTYRIYMLGSLMGDSVSKGQIAHWNLITVVPGTGYIGTVKASNGITVSPVADNVNIYGDGATITTAGAADTVTFSIVPNPQLDGLTVATGNTTLTALASTPASGLLTISNTGLLSTTDTGDAGTVLVGTATVPKFLTAGNAGEILMSQGAGADPKWTTADFPATVDTGDILAATAHDVVGVIDGTTATLNYVLTANGPGVLPSWQNNPVSGIAHLDGDAGTATGATVTIAGGTNLTTSAALDTVTINLDAALSGTTSHVFANAGYLGTGTTAADTLLLRAYNVNGTSYTTFATLTAHATTPTMDLASAVTIASNYIYRATGTDVPVTDGGTGASTFTANGVLLGNGAGALAVTAAGTDGTVLTGHTGAAPTWEVGGGGGLTPVNATANVNPAVVNRAYTINHATPATMLVVTLPSTYSIGDRIAIVGNTAGMWQLTAYPGTTINLLSTPIIPGGTLTATTRYDCVEIVCTETNTTWVVSSMMGNLTVA